jgi:enamine deaminase RidA (YjgF/YER057c/UK114 family)
LNDEVEHEETTESPKSYYSATSSVERANQFRSPKSEAMEGRREGELEEIDIDRFSPRSATQASAADGSTGDTGEREQEQVDEAKGTGTGTEKGRSNSRVASVTGQVVDLSKGLRNRVGSGVKGLWGRVAGKKHEHESSEGREQTTAEADEFEFKSEEGESHDAYVLGERERAESQHAAALQQSADDDQESQSGQVQNSFGAGESSAGDAMNQSIDFQAESNVPVIHCRKQGGLLFLSEATAAHDPLWESEAGEGDNAQVSVIDEAFVVFSLIKNTVARAGLEMSDVVRVDLALTDLNLLESVDDAFFQFFSQEPFPARTVTAGCQLPGTARLQATCIVSDPNVETLGVTGGGGGRRALRKGVRGSIRGGPEKVDTVRWLGSKVPVALGGIGYRSSSLSDATGALVKQRERRKADVVLRVSELCSCSDCGGRVVVGGE